MSIEEQNQILQIFANLQRREQKSVLSELLNDYTVNQTQISLKANLRSNNLMRKIRSGQLDIVHEYDTQTDRTQKIFLKAEAEEFIKEIERARSKRKRRN